jgi:hypothetical protein
VCARPPNILPLQNYSNQLLEAYRRHEKKRNAYTRKVGGKSKLKRLLVIIRVGGNIILKWTLEKLVEVVWTGFI